ncbi:MAG: transglutaminase domain-containing protein [Clostridiales bacterium]|nr:transglutaminase domain-containing protein [Clostridiales bacterium]
MREGRAGKNMGRKGEATSRKRASHLRAGRTGRRQALTENRLEKTRATVQEQQEQAEKLERKKRKKNQNRALQQVRPVRKNAEPTMLTVLFASLLSVMLGLGFTSMLTTTYNFEMNYYVFFFALGAVSVGAAYCHAAKEKTSAIVLAVSMAVLGIFILVADVLDARTQAEYVYSILQQKAFHGLRAFFTEIEKKEGPVTVLMILANFIPAYFTSYTIVKRKHVFFSIIWYVPFLLASTVVTFVLPSAWACELAVAGVLLLLVFQFVRRIGDSAADERMLKIMVPILMLCVLIGFIFPAKGYKMNEAATEQFGQVQKAMKSISEALKIGDTPDGNTLAEDQIRKNGYKGSILAGNNSEGASVTKNSNEDLSRVGFFNPPDIPIMEISRFYNDTATRKVMVSARYVYLRCASMEVMEGNSWRTYCLPAQPRDEAAFYTNVSEIEDRESDFVVKLHPLCDINACFIPGYVDHFYVSEESKFSDLQIPERRNWNMNECIPNTGEETIYFAYNEVPQKASPEWTPEYLDEVYSICLDVPTYTKNGIMQSGVLPDWYLELLNGERTMSTAEKVNAVVEFVRDLHPYNVDTPYPPEGKDFVTWFMSESRSGFCVHFATTAAVLLRMVGVPTRYCTGYMVPTEVNGTVANVSMKHAHAWFEFFDPDYGWIIDDPTPGNGIAASYHNAYAIAKEYGDMVSDFRFTPTPSPTPRAVLTPAPSEEEGKEEENAITVSDIFLHPVAIAIYAFAVFLLILRLLYILYWNIRFRTLTMLRRAGAYCQYFDMHMHILDGQGSRVATSIWKKAEYSEEGITKEELLRLVKFGKHNLQIQKYGRPFMRRFLSAILRVRI